MKMDQEYLYGLLPAYHRLLDAQQGEPLKAFIQILARESLLVEQNMDQLYRDWFIETCEEWVVPYIGELLGVKGVHEINENKVFSRRAYVANTLSYRRRKGTVPVVEQLARDITGWRAGAVEFFQRLATTQNMNHLRPHTLVTVAMTQMDALDLIDSPFETATRTVHVGNISRGLGTHNIPNLGVYLWRLNSYPMQEGEPLRLAPNFEAIPNGAVTAKKIADGAYTFSPLGLDTQLFNNPQTERTITTLAKEINVPGLLRRRGMHEELMALQNNGESIGFLETHQPVWAIFDGNGDRIDTDAMVICNLSNWKRPPADKVAIDPILGRLTFGTNPVEPIAVDYSYGFSGDLGGGPYDRNTTFDQAAVSEENTWHTAVSAYLQPIGTETIHPTLQDAIAAWNALGNAQGTGVITIMDSRTYDLSAMPTIEIQEGATLYLIAAQWIAVKDENDNWSRPAHSFNAEGVRPHLMGDLTVIGTAPATSNNGGSLKLNGLLLEGNISVLAGNLETFEVGHCSILPGNTLSVANQTGIFELQLLKSICGAITIASEDAILTLKASIIDAKNADAIAAFRTHLCIEESTIWGNVNGQQLDASNTLFNDLVTISRRQHGCVRFSYVTLDSITPKRYRCQPELALQQASAAETPYLIQKTQPTYNSTAFGHHAYAQLHTCTPEAITRGADNETEMGVFNFLQQAQRISNLNIALEEYIRLGMETGLIYVT